MAKIITREDFLNSIDLVERYLIQINFYKKILINMDKNKIMDVIDSKKYSIPKRLLTVLIALNRNGYKYIEDVSVDTMAETYGAGVKIVEDYKKLLNEINNG